MLWPTMNSIFSELKKKKKNDARCHCSGCVCRVSVCVFHYSLHLMCVH